MNVKKKWKELLVPGLAALVLLMAGTVQIANAYVYVEDEYAFTNIDASGMDSGAPGYYTNGNGDAYADETGFCICESIADTYTKTCEYSTSAYAVTNAIYKIDWTWNGPPGEAPGGTLSWSLDGVGGSYVSGVNYLAEIDDTAYSSSNGESGLAGLGTGQSAVHGIGQSWGWVEDKDDSDCDFSTSANPVNDLTITDSDADNDYRSYEAYVLWNYESDDDVAITSGNTYVYFMGGVQCEADSEAISTGTGSANAFTGNMAYVDVWADFD
jgi:hypothetical protein